VVHSAFISPEPKNKTVNRLLTFARIVPKLATKSNRTRDACMHVMTRQRLQEFWEHYPDAEQPLRSWLAIMRQKHYSGPHELRQDFATASFWGHWRTVFNIGGNK